jgi:hypothetical protein
LHLSDIISDPAADWTRQTPAPRAVVQALSGTLPEGYRSFFLFSNGGEGPLPYAPGWFQIWPVEQVLDLNQAYGVDEFLPGFFAFGSNGGDEMLVFDLRQEDGAPVYAVPFIPMNPAEAVRVAPSFLAFVRALGRLTTEPAQEVDEPAP